MQVELTLKDGTKLTVDNWVEGDVENNRRQIQAAKDKLTRKTQLEQETDQSVVPKEVLDEHYQLGKETTSGSAYVEGLKKGVPVVGDVLSEKESLFGPVKPAVQRAYQEGQAQDSPVADLAGQATTAGAGAATLYGAGKLLAKKVPGLSKLDDLISPMKGPHLARATKGATISGAYAYAEDYARSLTNSLALDYYRLPNGNIDWKTIGDRALQSASFGAAMGLVVPSLQGLISKAVREPGKGLGILNNERAKLSGKIKVNNQIIEAAKNKDKETLKAFGKDPNRIWNAFKDEFSIGEQATDIATSAGVGALRETSQFLQKQAAQNLANSVAITAAKKVSAEAGKKAVEKVALQAASQLGLASSLAWSVGTSVAVYAALKAAKIAVKAAKKPSYKKMIRQAELDNANLQRQIDELDRGLGSITVLLSQSGAQGAEELTTPYLEQYQQWNK